jgi:hypothetical protein
MKKRKKMANGEESCFTLDASYVFNPLGAAIRNMVTFLNSEVISTEFNLNSLY